MATHRVSASALNLRSAPDPTQDNRIVALPQGTPVTKLGDAVVAGWWEVETEVSGKAVQGFVNSSFLAQIGAGPDAPSAAAIVEVHLRGNHQGARRDSTSARPYPISEAGRPGKLAGSPAQRAEGLRGIIDWLGVDTGLRWKRTSELTFCNIYAYDVAYLAGVYLPRVWWRSKALLALSQGKTVSVEYDATVHELNANALTDWFEDFGTMFGWRRAFDLTEMQDAANAGQVAVIVAHNVRDKASGHIQIVAPEGGGVQATRKDGRVVNPVQSQAGAQNFRYGALGANWFAAPTMFSKHGFWIHA